MEKLKNGIYATAMNEYIYKVYEDFDFKTDDDAEDFLYTWLALGVPDGNSLEDNINDFGDKEEINELLDTFLNLCKKYKVSPNYSKEIEEIKKNIVEMLDNPYYDMV